MLVLTLDASGQSARIGPIMVEENGALVERHVDIKLLRIRSGNTVALAFDAPRSVEIHRRASDGAQLPHKMGKK